ncbi:MAG: hypothetical protein PHG05_03260 [Candidatus Nanoarchaeia archaeon]|nr:hypothetical protein [Candidatus Nanoarchaeia archaeon]
MNHKLLGIILIVASLILGLVVITFNSRLNAQADLSCSCTEMQNGGVCAHEQTSTWPTYLGIILSSIIVALGVYLIFFEKSQRQILSTLEKQKETSTEEERFSILLKGLSDDEKKIIKAVKEQDGITQQTLRFRADLHKSKLSILLDGLEKKGLIKKVLKGKTNQVYLKIKI